MIFDSSDWELKFDVRHDTRSQILGSCDSIYIYQHKVNF